MEFKIESLIQYLENTSEDDWIVDRVRTNSGEGCLMSHVFDWGGGDETDENGYSKGASAWDWFEEVWATTFMIYPVNDKENPKYQQDTTKERCISYLKNLRDGKEKSTLQLVEEYTEKYAPQKD